MKSFSFTVRDPMGIHARPAGLLASRAAACQSRIRIRTDMQQADADDIPAVMLLNVTCGQTICVEITGTDEEQAYQEMKRFFEETL